MTNQKNYWVLGHKITPVKISGNYDMVIGETAPSIPGPPPHFHARTSELFMVLEGEMEFNINGNTRLVKQGETVDLPISTVHTFKNSANKPCKWVNIHSPKGFLSFFEDMGVDANEAESFEKSVDDAVIQRVMKEAARYDMHIKM